jgi:hypothetical protein
MMPGIGYIGGRLSIVGGYSWPGAVDLIEEWDEDRYSTVQWDPVLDPDPMLGSAVPFCFLLYLTAYEGPMRILYKYLVPIYVFPEMKLCGLVISKTEL